MTGVLLGALTLGLDVLTGPYLMFPILFVLPVLLLAWHGHRRWSYLLAVALPCARAYIATYVKEVHPGEYAVVNAMVRISVLLLLAYLAHRTSRQVRDLRREVDQFGLLLPVCVFCRRIKVTEDRWQSLDQFVSSRSQDPFRHTFCPECGKAHAWEFGDGSGG